MDWTSLMVKNEAMITFVSVNDFVMNKWLSWFERAVIILMALLPLLGNYPYRLNIFLSWEGAYRLYLGQVPFKDFGIPLGFMYWVVPALAFKVFGPYLFTLVKAQVLLNIIAGFSFRSILKSLQVAQPFRAGAVLVFVVSYSMLNYWPWYNHTVIVYQLVGLACLFKFLADPTARKGRLWLVGAGVGFVFSFFTKQDGGALGILLALALLGYDALQRKRVGDLLFMVGVMALLFALMILPFLPYQFNYWFNHGQAPHTARVSPYDLISNFFASAQWIRFYLLVWVLIVLHSFRSLSDIWKKRQHALFALLTLGILVEAAILEVTSYVPPDNNIFFHSFAFAFILTSLASYTHFNWIRLPVIGLLFTFIMVWWSQSYWRFGEKWMVAWLGGPKTGPGIVNKNTYLIPGVDSTDVPVHLWKQSPHPAFQRMLMPPATVDGIEQILALPALKNPAANILNMSELTPLAYTAPFTLETGSHYPLWYHLGVGMFGRELELFKTRIQKQAYDVVIFEYIPYLNNFYPFEVRTTLQQHYTLKYRFTAPRKPSMQAWVEVYVRPSAQP